MIAVESIACDIGGVRALDGVSFSTSRSETLGIAGPDGAGKTTLFDLLGGFLAATGGAATIDGARIEGHGPDDIARRGIARTHQVPRLFARMTVLENAMAGAYRHTRSRRAAEEAARAALTMLGLERKSRVWPRGLTPSERCLLEIARAFASSPAVLLLDEPFAQLERAHADMVLACLLPFARERAGCVLLAERDVAPALRSCDRVIVLHAGKKIAEGTPDAVSNDPDVRDAFLGVEWRQ